MSATWASSLRTGASLRVLDGFGRSVLSACRYVAPRSTEELMETLARAKSEELTVAFRGSGRSYGDAAMNERGLVVDTTRLNRVLRWEPGQGILEAEAGLTIEGLWRRTIEDGYWPAVVPGTMHPTLGGCVAMNIHGKNNFRVGPFGDHVLGLDLLTAGGDLISCSREENPDVFHAVIGGLGLLGAVVRVRLKLKQVKSGRLRVLAVTARSMDETFDLFEALLPKSDYVVGWTDCFARRGNLGRSALHAANYFEAGEDPDAQDSLHVEKQGLPASIFGLPKGGLWKLMRPFTNAPGMAFINALRFHTAHLASGSTYVQSHVAFAFLLDYVPNWRLAYGPGGLIQYQIFVPHGGARECFHDVLTLCQRHRQVPYLGVMKRHRPDAYLLSHALDGWSMAMDFRVTRRNRARLWALTQVLTERVLDAGGKFYFAKDAVLRPNDVDRAYGRARLDQFNALKQKLDPANLFASDLTRRAFG